MFPEDFRRLEPIIAGYGLDWETEEEPDGMIRAIIYEMTEDEFEELAKRENTIREEAGYED